ncbi:MAG: LptF/LptG family permease [Proteobacteria bacterium]|nr:LptF/LptG family permease [Pseudomonadota bacterium]
MLKKLHSFILNEFFSLFNGIFFGLLLMFLVIKFLKIYEMIGFNIPFKYFLSFIFLSLPDATLIILPITFLISLSITLTKLASTNELIAIQCAGISPYRILKIFLIISLNLTIFTAILSIFIKPQSNFILRKNIERLAQGKILILPRTGEFRKIFENTYLYADRNEETMQGLIFFQPRNGISIQMITAKTGKIEKQDTLNVFNLTNGTYLKIEEDKINVLNFNKMKLNPFSEIEKKDEYDINRGSLPTNILVTKLMDNKITPAQKTELFHRIFFPFSIVIFLFIAFPLSWRHGRSYKTSGIIISVIASLIFYITFSSINALATRGIINPLIGYPSAIFILLTLGLIIYYFKFIRLS